MIRSRCVGLLVIVLGLPPAAASGQEDPQRMAKVLCAGDPECESLAQHRLTADNLRKMFAVDRELIPLTKQVPDLERRMEELARSIDPQGRLGNLTVSARVHEGIPEIAEILRRHRTSGREYVFTYAVAMVTAMIDVTPAAEMMTPALRFWRSMDPALKAEAEAWKKMRGYDQGINR